MENLMHKTSRHHHLFCHSAAQEPYVDDLPRDGAVTNGRPRTFIFMHQSAVFPELALTALLDIPISFSSN